MTKKEEQIKYIYNDYESLYIAEANKKYKEEDLLKLFKEYSIPKTTYHISAYKKYGIISENNKLFTINAVDEQVFISAVKEARNKLNQVVKKSRNNNNNTPKILNEEEKEKEYIKFLKQKGYKITKLVKVPITTYKEEWQEV